MNQSCFDLGDKLFQHKHGAAPAQLPTGAEFVTAGFGWIVCLVLTGHEGVVDDLEQQPELSPQDRQHLFGPRQQRQTSGPDSRHFCPFAAALGTNGRSHLTVFGTVLTYSGIPRRKAAGFAYSSVTNAGSCCRNVEPFGAFKLVLSASVLHLCSSCC